MPHEAVGRSLPRHLYWRFFEEFDLDLPPPGTLTCCMKGGTALAKFPDGALPLQEGASEVGLSTPLASSASASPLLAGGEAGAHGPHVLFPPGRLSGAGKPVRKRGRKVDVEE